jgi:hypothetical protein
VGTQSKSNGSIDLGYIEGSALHDKLHPNVLN